MKKEIFDIHCHVIPYVDDGAASMKESIRLLQMEYEQGVRHMIVTPHFRLGMFETSQELVQRRFQQLKKAGDLLGMNLYLGCEFHSTMDMIPLLTNHEVPTMAGSRYVLIEFSGGDYRSYIRERIYTLLTSGYIPVIAHIERYDALYNKFDFIEELTEMGALMQVNADSLIGKCGFGMKSFCKKLMKQDYLSFVGSDCHDSRERVPRIGEAYQYVAKKMGEAYADEIFYMNPMRMVLDHK